MVEYKIEFDYNGQKVILDLRRVVAITRPDNGVFRIYFENAIWGVKEKEFERVYNAWMAL